MYTVDFITFTPELQYDKLPEKVPGRSTAQDTITNPQTAGVLPCLGRKRLDGRENLCYNIAKPLKGVPI